MAKANTRNWQVERIDADTVIIKVPANDVLGKRRADGKRPFKLPMRKIIEKLRQQIRPYSRQWDYAYVELSKDGETTTWKLTK